MVYRPFFQGGTLLPCSHGLALCRSEVGAVMAAALDSGIKHWLSLNPAVPRFAFCNVWFPLAAYLLDAKKKIKTGWTLPLQIELLNHPSQEVVSLERR